MEILIPSEKRWVKLAGKNKEFFQTGVGKLNDCCRNQENLFLANQEEGGKLIVWECKACHRCHYVLKIEHGYIGMADASNVIRGVRLEDGDIQVMKKILTGEELNDKEISALKRFYDRMLKKQSGI